MKTIVINVDDIFSAKLFLDLARKLHFKARVLTYQQKEERALLAMMNARDIEPELPVESVLDILRKRNCINILLIILYVVNKSKNIYLLM